MVNSQLKAVRKAQLLLLAHLYMPSCLRGPIAASILCVSRKGTLSGHSNASPLLNRQLKSTCTVSPFVESNDMFSPCLSPRPSKRNKIIYLIMLFTYFKLRLLSHRLTKCVVKAIKYVLLC